MKDRYGMRMHWLCRVIGHRWISTWSAVGHIEGAEWRSCQRGCGTGQMRQGPLVSGQGSAQPMEYTQRAPFP